MRVLPYSSSFCTQWDAAVAGSRNGTFLFFRGFMEYHSTRLRDASLIFMDDRGRIKGLLPASWHSECQEIRSHGGLTYGGLVLASETHAVEAGEMYSLAMEYYVREYHAHRLVVRPVPYIYHHQPSDDELYWLFRYGAKLCASGLASVIDLCSPGPLAKQRKRCLNHALKSNLEVHEACIEDTTAWSEYWNVLTEVLQSRHGVNPVHSLDEITLLAKRFPDHIRLKVVRYPASRQIIAGTILFLSSPVVHVQYIASTSEGRGIGALDLLFVSLCKEYSRLEGFRYLDFGISTENGGLVLNEGLNRQKEGFGARSVVYQAFEMEL